MMQRKARPAESIQRRRNGVTAGTEACAKVAPFSGTSGLRTRFMQALPERVCQRPVYAVGSVGHIREFNPITKEDDHRQNAAETIELANRATTSADKGRLLRLAENWLDLADRAARLAKRFGPKRRREFGPDHPLVRQALDHLDTD